MTNQIQYVKVPVGVNLYVQKDGQIRLKSFCWKDGAVYKIDKTLRVERAASTKVGGFGMRYTIMVEGKPHYIFEENGQWFVEGVRVPVSRDES